MTSVLQKVVSSLIQVKGQWAVQLGLAIAKNAAYAGSSTDLERQRNKQITENVISPLSGEVWTVLTCDAESWTLTKTDENRIAPAEL